MSHVYLRNVNYLLVGYVHVHIYCIKLINSVLQILLTLFMFLPDLLLVFWERGM